MANQYSAPSTSFGLPQTLRLPEEQKHINVITFSEDGTFLAVATGGDSNSGCLTIWEVSERVSRLRQAQSIGFNSPVRAAAWCGGSAISVGHANGQIWDISSATGNISEDTEPIFRMTAPIHNIAYDSASKRVLVGSGCQVILANWPTLWIKSNAVESTTVDDVPVEVKFHSTSGSCFIAWLKEGVQFAHAQGETAGLVKVKGDHDSVVPESDNPWDNSWDRQHDTYDTATQSLDPHGQGQPGHLHGTLAHTRDSDHDQDRNREHSESEEEEEEKSEVPTGWQAGLPFLYDFLRDEGWLELARKELFGNGVRARLLRTLVKACWPSVTPDESEFYGYTRLRENTELTKLRLRPNEPVTMLYMLELVLLATGWPYRISETPRKKTPIPETLVPQKLVQLLDQLTGDKLKSVYVTAVQAIKNTGELRQPKHLQCMVEILAMAVFGLYCLRLPSPYKFETVYDQSILPPPSSSFGVVPSQLRLLEPGSPVQFCLGSKPKAMVMVDQLFYKGLYDSLEKLNVLSFLKRIPQLVVDKDSMREMSVFFEFLWHKGNNFTWRLGSPHHHAYGQHHQIPVSPHDHNQAQTSSHLAGSESQSYAKDNSLSSGTTFRFRYVQYMQPPTPTVALEHNGKSGGGSAKKRSRSSYENHAKKRQAVEADPLLQHDVFASSISIARADTCLSSSVQPTKELPFMSIPDPGIFYPSVLMTSDITPDGSEPASANPGENTDLAWHEDSGTTFRFCYVQYMQPPIRTADLEHNGKSGGGSAKRRSSSGYENHAKKRRAVEVDHGHLLQHDIEVSLVQNNLPENSAPYMSIAPAATWLSSPVQPTKALPFIPSIPGIFDPGVLMPEDMTPAGSESVSASSGGNTALAWNEDPVWKALCSHDDIWLRHCDTLEDNNHVDDLDWAKYITWPEA
ncbi:hypothetical protein GGX14DRAFT_580152 [Mycena pura]|uniref:Uncharacterized protein n=1 Tax=Mycena pura TaxID=153505 RepID=A0AAD6XW30_9AGAR|nr:hypothetical protein GGX14DRAFT_580152 [Mycena pura]